LAKKNRTVTMPPRGNPDTSKGSAKTIAETTVKETLTDEQKKLAAQKRRAAKKAAYPLTILNVKLNKGAQNRDLTEALFAAAKVWAAENSYVLTMDDPSIKKSGATLIEVVVDTPESFASKTKVKGGDATMTREIGKAIATALRSDAVKAKAIELNTSPKDLVLQALSSQFGIAITV
jgi:hypothetical protein